MNDGFKITVVYDNHTPEAKGLKSSWGFACVIEGFEKTILFDTGTSGPILMNNLEVLGFNPVQFDTVIISHGDWDHLGGLWTFLDANPSVEVYLPASLSRHLKDEVDALSAGQISVGEESVEVCPGIILSGEMKGPRNEQAVLLLGEDRQVVLTGCAHPGIVEITQRLSEISPDLPMLVMGGFHLKDSSDPVIQGIIDELLQCGTQWVAPTHCSGERAEVLFAQHFGAQSISLCPGSVLSDRSLV